MASRLDVINKEDLLDYTNNGLDIYHEEVKLTKKGYNYKGLCPLHSEKTGSFTVFPSGNFKCFGCGETGDVFTLLMKKYGITYRQALERVRDQTQDLQPINKKITKKVEKKPIFVEFKDIPYTKEGHRYWNEYEISSEFLLKNHIYQVSRVLFDGKEFKLPKGAVRFCYYSVDLNECKFLTVNGETTKEDKWRSINIPDTYIWYYNDYKENSCKNLFIQKSIKDALIFKMLNLCTVATQSENAVNLLKNKDRINLISSNPTVVFGNDKQAKEQSHMVTKETGWKHLNVPDFYLNQGINDFAELSKTYGLKMVETEIRKKFL